MGRTYKNLAAGKAWMIVPPMTTVLLTGVQRADQAKDGTITLWYTDASSEKAFLPSLDLIQESDAGTLNFFAVVSAVQEAARKVSA